MTVLTEKSDDESDASLSDLEQNHGFRSSWLRSYGNG